MIGLPGKRAKDAPLLKVVMMKQILLIISILIPLSTGAATSRGAVPRGRVSAVISECRHYKGAEVVSLGRMATAAVKAVVRAGEREDPDLRQAVRLMKGIRSVSVFSFEDCSEKDKERIVRKLDRALTGSEMLMETKDGAEKMRIYGVLDERTDQVRDFVLYAPGDCALICLFGRFSADALAKLAADE